MPGIKLKAKTEMPADATKVARKMTAKEIEDGANNRISRLSDKEVEGEFNSEMSMLGENGPKAKRALKEVTKRTLKKEDSYAMGTKGIKIKSKADKAK